MNSFATRDASLDALERYGDLPVTGVEADFLQSKVPKLDADDLTPVEWPQDTGLEWAPPGHGDLYPSLQSSGMLEALLDGGYRYAFVANVDNLGAVMSPRILAWFAREQIPFLMEVADRTAADRKGGHLAQRAGGGGSGLVLREIAQTPRRTSRPSRTRSATGSSTRTRCGSTCTPCATCSMSATACSACR